jgi:hypothetical protein
MIFTLREPFDWPRAGWNKEKDEADTYGEFGDHATLQGAMMWTFQEYRKLMDCVEEVLRVFPEFIPQGIGSSPDECIFSRDVGIFSDFGLVLEQFEEYLTTQPTTDENLIEGLGDTRFICDQFKRIIDTCAAQPNFHWMHPWIKCGTGFVGATDYFESWLENARASEEERSSC